MPAASSSAEDRDNGASSSEQELVEMCPDRTLSGGSIVPGAVMGVAAAAAAAADGATSTACNVVVVLCDGDLLCPC